MKKIVSLLLFLSALFYISCKSNSNQIKEVFDNYKNGIIKRDGKLIKEILDSGTLKYYSKILNEAVLFDSSKLETSSLNEKLVVLKIRHYFSKEIILSMQNGDDLLIAMVNKGIDRGNPNVSRSDLGKITITNDSAEANKMENGKEQPFRYLFRKENNEWKIMEVYNRVGGSMIRLLAANEKMSVNDFIFEILEQGSGAKPSEKIWLPLK